MESGISLWLFCTLKKKKVVIGIMKVILVHYRDTGKYILTKAGGGERNEDIGLHKNPFFSSFI